MKPDAICIFIATSISIFISGKPYLQRPFLKLTFKTINFFICVIVYSDTINNKNFGNESYFKFVYGNFSYTGESPNATPNKDW
jgi:hypothetical protein